MNTGSFHARGGGLSRQLHVVVGAFLMAMSMPLMTGVCAAMTAPATSSSSTTKTDDKGHSRRALLKGQIILNMKKSFDDNADVRRYLQEQVTTQFNSCKFQQLYSIDLTDECENVNTCDCYDEDNNKTAGTYWTPPSEWSACISSFKLDKDNATQYLESLINLTQDYYAFTDIAVAPLKSDPNTTLFGYPIYDGNGGGQVDLIGEMKDLAQKVKDAGSATLDLFLKVNAIYSKLLDGHASINLKVNTAGMLDDYSAGFISGEVLSGEANAVKLYVAYPSENNEFILMANVTGTDGKATTKRITKIGDADPLEFFNSVSSTDPYISALKSLGPRIQNVVKELTMPTGPFFGFVKAGGPPCSRPRCSAPNLAEVFQDSYVISYDDGTATKWQVLQLVPCVVSLNKTKEKLEEDLTEPGYLYDNYQAANNELISAFSRRNLQRKETVTNKKDRRLQQDTSGGSIDFKLFAGTIGVAVFDDYAVLKVDKEFDYDPDEMVHAWSVLTSDAASKNVRKLIVDIIGNGGGKTDLAYQLAQFMYPNATFGDMANPYDMPYSPAVDVFWNEVFPLLSNATQLSVSQVQDLTDVLNEDPVALATKMNQTSGLFEAMYSISGSNVEISVATVQYIIDNVLARSPTSIMVIEMIQIIQQLYSLQQTPDAINYFNLDGDGLAPIPVPHIRGGIAGNYTNPFYLLTPEKFILAKRDVIGVAHPFQFNQYIILADGNGVGSSSNTFQTTATQYGKTGGALAATLSTVSFGGSGKKEDAAVTQFAGGFVDEPNLDELYLPFFILLVVYTIGNGSPLLSNAVDVLNHYNDVMPEPCYYCESTPSFPLSEIYSALIGPDSIPLEYVNQLPDYYIKQWPSKTSMTDDSDLPYLYDRTSAFFEDQGPPNAGTPADACVCENGGTTEVDAGSVEDGSEVGNDDSENSNGSYCRSMLPPIIVIGAVLVAGLFI